MNLTSLEQLIDMLRTKGVVEFHGEWASAPVRIVLGPPPPLAATPDVQPVDKPAVSGKVGRDGLTAEQQLEVYGCVMDAEE